MSSKLGSTYLQGQIEKQIEFRLKSNQRVDPPLIQLGKTRMNENRLTNSKELKLTKSSSEGKVKKTEKEPETLNSNKNIKSRKTMILKSKILKVPKSMVLQFVINELNSSHLFTRGKYGQIKPFFICNLFKFFIIA